MEEITSFEDAERKILNDIHECINTIRSIVSPEIQSISHGVDALMSLRRGAYENINQIQHEELAFRAARSLKEIEYSGQSLRWYWNPRQTGNSTEPDLQARHEATIVLSAEVTTSDRPIGTIGTRMQHTLRKLSNMPGRKFYFVRTDAMQRKAQTTVSEAGYEVEVRKI